MRKLMAMCIALALALPLAPTAQAVPLAPSTATLTDAKGTLIVAGGGPLPESVLRAFVTAAGGRAATIGVLPVASGDPLGSFAAVQSTLSALGAQVHLLDVRARADSERQSLLALANTCSGYWFTGGDQNRIGDLVVGTPLHALIVQRYRQGAAVGGTSAGAAAMSRIMLTGKGDPSETRPGTFQTRTGLGLLPGTIVDQHFLRRQRQNRLFSLIQEHPDHLGLGIDEETALQVTGGQATVVGNRQIFVVDPAPARIAPGGAHGLVVHLLGPGQGLDLNRRLPQPR